MKIVCMDCQSESYSDLESFKADRHFVCAQCAEESRSILNKEAGASLPSALDERFESGANSPQELSANLVSAAQDEEVLDLSDAVFITEHSEQVTDEQVILLPELETQPPVLEEEAYFPQTTASLLKAESLAQESRVVSQVTEHIYPLQNNSLSDAQPSAAPNASVTARAEGMRLVSFSASKQVILAVACVVAIVLVQALASPSNRTAMKAESPGQQAAPAVPQIEHQAAQSPAQVALNSPIPAPTPSPAVAVEEKPVVAPPVKEQPVEQPKGLFTLQVGSHQDVAEANAQADKLRAAGFAPRVVSAEIPKRGTWYRVQVGDFSTRDEANSFGATLRAKGVADNFIVAGL